jgi:hypothetical protein
LFSLKKPRAGSAIARVTGCKKLSSSTLDSSSLHGEREIIDGNLQLCLAYPHNATVRVLLLQTLDYMKKVRPEVVEEFRGKVEKLQREYGVGLAEERVI